MILFHRRSDDRRACPSSLSTIRRSTSMSPPPSLHDLMLAAWKKRKAVWERRRAADLGVSTIPLIDVAQWEARNPRPAKPRRPVRVSARSARGFAAWQREQADAFHAVACGDKPPVIQGEQHSLERALRCELVAARGLTRPTTRRRGAGRPRAQAARSSAKSGDSPDDPPRRRPTLRLAPPSRAVFCCGLLSAAERGEAAS